MTKCLTIFDIGLVEPGAYAAIVKFFAFADDNKMPIRRVLVDWGDGSTITNEDRYGMYKNHKPVCSEEEDGIDEQVGRCVTTATIAGRGTQPVVGGETGLTCRSGHNEDCLAGEVCVPVTETATFGYPAPFFGDAPRACEENYFSFGHTYDCSKADRADAASENPEHTMYVSQLTGDIKRKVIALGLREGVNPETGDQDFVCIFKPKAQVMDNWGWCNGTCQDYNGDRVTDLRDGCYQNARVVGFVETFAQCDTNVWMPNTDPRRPWPSWTEYKGNIVVVPMDLHRENN